MFEQVLLDAAVSHLKQLISKGNFDSFDVLSKVELFQKGGKGFSYFPFLKLSLEVEEKRPDRTDLKIIQAANTVLDSIDSTALAVYFGTHQEPEKKMVEQREDLAEAISKKALAQSRMVQRGEAPLSQLSDTLQELSKWVSISDKRFQQLNIAILEDKKQYALALQELQKVISDKKLSPAEKKPLLEKQKLLFDLLGWNLLSKEASKNLLVKFPSSFPLF